MASTCSSRTTHSICVVGKRVFDWRKEEGEAPSGGLASESHLILGLQCIIDVNNREITKTTFMSRHRFIDCVPSNLEAFMQNTEPLPMNLLMENEEAEMTRLSISLAIACHVRNCSRVEGLKGLIVHVILKVYVTEGEEKVASILSEMRMAFVQRKLYMGGGQSGSSSSRSVRDDEVCAVCLEGMGEGENEVIRTPCKHQFHAGCIRRWFENSGFCPLCRFNIGP